MTRAVSVLVKRTAASFQDDPSLWEHDFTFTDNREFALGTMPEGDY